MKFRQTNDDIYFSKNIVSNNNFTVNGIVKTNEINSAPGDLILKRNGEEYVKFGNSTHQVEFSKSLLIKGGQSKSQIREAVENAGADNMFKLWNKETTKNPIITFGLGAVEKVLSINTDKIISTQPINCNTINTDGDNNLAIQRNGTTILTLENDRITMANGFTFNNDTLISDTVSTNQILADRFRCKNTNVNIDIDGGNSTGDARLVYLV